MSTKAGRVTMKDVRQGKTFWMVMVNHLSMPNEYTREEEKIVCYSRPKPIQVIRKVFYSNVKMYGFSYNQRFRTAIDTCNLEAYQGNYRHRRIVLAEYFASRKAAERFIKLNENTMLTQKDINRFEEIRQFRIMMEADCYDYGYDSLWISEKP